MVQTLIITKRGFLSEK